MLTFLFVLSAFFVLKKDSPKVMGMIAKVRTNLTVTALSKVVVPKLYIASQVEAAAVTEEVSLIAEPAKTPKPSVVILRNDPRVGKISAARMLKKKMTEIA